MKLSELNVGTEYAVVPHWTYSNRDARNPDSVQENDVVKAILLSKEKYVYDSGNKYSDTNSFELAEAGNRSVGVIVKASDRELYWTTRLSDVVAPHADLEPRWAKEKQEREDKEREENERRARAEQKANEVRERVRSARNSVIATTKELLGEKCEVSVDTNGYGEQVKAQVTMGLDEYERLIEMAYEGKVA